MIGPSYHYNDPSTTGPATAKKIETISRKDPTLGAFLEDLFGIKKGVASNDSAKVTKSTESAMTSLDRYSRNLVQTLFSQELALSKSVHNTTSNVSGGIQKGTESITRNLDGLSKKINETLKPVSTALGSTLGTLTQVAKDPLGAPTFLSHTMGDVVKRVNPDFYNRMDATFKKYKLDTHSHLPDQLMGSARNLLTAADAILAVPLGIISDLYFGLMNIMKEISSAVDQIMASVTKLFFGPGGLLDSIIPISMIMEFLDAIGGLAGQLTGISQVFSGANQIASVALQAQNLGNQFGNFIQNPMDLASAYMPQQLSQGLYALQNPQSLVDQYLPPQLSQQFAKISQITGFGFNGNMGFGLQSVLDGMKGGVISSIVGNFANQYAILTPILNLGAGGGGGTLTNKAYPPMLKPSAVNPSIQTAHGVPQLQTPPPKIFTTQ
jgi:hypothetical protein